MMRRLLLPAVVSGCVAVAQPVLSCTMFTKTADGRTFVGNSEDYFEADTHAVFIPPSEGKYGRVYFGWANVWPQGGMNDQGLTFDIMALKREPQPPPEGRERCVGVLGLAKKIMEECSTVEEALRIIDRYVNPHAAAGNLMLADATGDSAIIEGYQVHRREGPFQVCTNFRLSRVEGTDYPCKRYRMATARLRDCPVTVEAFRDILEAVHEPAPETRGTLYSNIYDLDNKLIYLYLFHDFDNVHIIDVAEELSKGQHVVPLNDYFPNNSREADFRARYEARKRKQFAATVRDLGAAPEPPADESLVLHLPLDGDVRDSGPNGLHGTVHGGAPAEDRHGNASGAVAFAGDGGIEVPDHQDLHLTSGDYTISFWLKLQRINDTYWVVIDKAAQGALDYWLLVARGNLEFRTRGERSLLTSVEALDPGRWHHVAIRQDVSTFRLALFLGGEKQYESIIQTSPAKNTESLRIGYSAVLHDAGLHGAIDDLRIYRRALRDGEIGALGRVKPLPNG